MQEGYERLKAAKHVLIIGGGPVGVELAAEIAEELPGKEARAPGPQTPPECGRARSALFASGLGVSWELEHTRSDIRII